MSHRCSALSALLLFVLLLPACVTYKNPPDPTAVALTLAAPMIDDKPTAGATAATRTPTITATTAAVSCAGLTAEECANAGEHTYTLTNKEYFQDGCESTEEIGTTRKRTFVFSAGQVNRSGYETYLQTGPNTYSRPEPTLAAATWQITFTPDGYFDDFLYNNAACVRETFVITP